MKDAFKLYQPVLDRKKLPSFHANQILLVKAEHKCLTVFYAAESGKVVEVIMNGNISINKLLEAHGDGFIRLHRNTIVNRKHLISCFPYAKDVWFAKVRWITEFVPVSRGESMKVRRALRQVE